MGLALAISGFLCVTSVPRDFGKILLKNVAWHTEPGRSCGI